MGRQIYHIYELPDLTMVKYSAEENSDVEDVLKQQALFYRQLNKRGLLFGESYRFIVSYVPGEKPGKRIHIWLEVTEEGESGLSLESQLLASPLATYYGIRRLKSADEIETEESALKEQVRTDEECRRIEKKYQRYRELAAAFEADCKEIDRTSYRTWLVKQGGNLMSSSSQSFKDLYTVDEWKMNDKARMIGLYKFMRALDQSCTYVVELIPVDYAKKARVDFEFQIQWIRTYVNGLDRDHRDENAEFALKQYSNFLELLRSNAHFSCRISACANSMATAKMLLDIVASEAVEEGGYQILENDCIADASAPMGMDWWRSVFTLKEIAPFIALPALYPGENIELPKETAPDHQKEEGHQYIYLGHELLSNDEKGYEVWVRLDSLKKHALLAGVPGGGKTRSMEHLIYQLCLPENNVPFVVLEPAKKEYRAVVGTPREFMKDITVFSPGGLGSFMLRINPFEFPVGMPLSEHMTSLMQVFEGAFDLEAPFPMLLIEGIEEIYRENGWFPENVNDGRLPYPTMSMLYKQLAIVLENKYAGEVKENLRSVMEVRIGSLLRGDMGNVFDVAESTLKPEAWLDRKCIVELEALGRDGSSFLTLLLCTLIREYLRHHPRDPRRSLRHVIFIEEAHNVIGPTTMPGGENGNSKIASTRFIVDMLAEVRALQEGIIIADQLPTALADQVTKNTALKIAHKMTAMDDRQVLGETMSMDSVQMEQMAFYIPGQALCIYDGVKKPFKVKIPDCVAEEQVPGEEPDNEMLYTWLADRDCYIKDMKRDWKIMMEKLDAQATENIRLTNHLANTYRQAELAKIRNEKEKKSTRANVQEMEQTLRKLARQIRNIQEEILKFVNYIERNRVMCSMFKIEVYEKWFEKRNAWTAILRSLSTYKGIESAFEKSPEPKDRIITATRYLLDGEQSNRVQSILGEL